MPDRPNVLFVLCDQMRGGAMSCADDPNVETPNLDRLAADGVRFADAHSTYPVCVPARVTLHTGAYAHSRDVPAIGYRLSPAEETLADRFGAAGYRTAMIGKWHLYNARGRQPVPPSHQGGFDYWRGFDLMNDPYGSQYWADDDPEPRDLEGHQTDALFDLAGEFLDDHADRDEPFFLNLSVEAPHPPYDAPERHSRRWADRDLELLPNVPYPEGQPPGNNRAGWGSLDAATEELYRPEGGPYLRDHVFDDLRAYYAMIEHLDENVGALLDDLEARGIREETVVVFLSDHGCMLGSHGLNPKQWPYRESTRVPFVVSHPGGDVDAGRVVETPTCSEDWFPTLCGLAGVDPGDVPGRDLAPVCRGETTLDRDGVLLQFCREERKHAEWAPFRRETWRAYLTESFRYAVKGGEPWQLFDRREDPYETENVLGTAAYEDVAADLHGALRDRLDAVDDDYQLSAAYGHAAL